MTAEDLIGLCRTKADLEQAVRSLVARNMTLQWVRDIYAHQISKDCNLLVNSRVEIGQHAHVCRFVSACGLDPSEFDVPAAVADLQARAENFETIDPVQYVGVVFAHDSSY